MAIHKSRCPAYADVETECQEQEKRWGLNSDRASQDPCLWLVVLAEEFGEVARELCEGWGAIVSLERLRAEIVQVAAVAVSWIEALDSDVTNCWKCCYQEIVDGEPDRRECPTMCPVLCAKRMKENAAGESEVNA
jgi:NTP pyrophosphatase (non-canonical NTP hydrolase)